jgi:energy-converting hydrogenase Eha subunit G
MNRATAVLEQLFGLFVDDGGLAAGIVVLVGGLALLVHIGAIGSALATGLLVAGLALLLAETVARAARARRR